MKTIKQILSENWLTISLLISSIVFCYAFYIEYNKNRELSAIIKETERISTIEIEGSKSNIYVVEDTSMGMVWIGVPGINLINRK